MLTYVAVPHIFLLVTQEQVCGAGEVELFRQPVADLIRVGIQRVREAGINSRGVQANFLMYSVEETVVEVRDSRVHYRGRRKGSAESIGDLKSGLVIHGLCCRPAVPLDERDTVIILPRSADPTYLTDTVLVDLAKIVDTDSVNRWSRILKNSVPTNEATFRWQCDMHQERLREENERSKKLAALATGN